jgi:hypothetical protein
MEIYLTKPYNWNNLVTYVSVLTCSRGIQNYIQLHTVVCTWQFCIFSEGVALHGITIPSFVYFVFVKLHIHIHVYIFIYSKWRNKIMSIQYCLLFLYSHREMQKRGVAYFFTPCMSKFRYHKNNASNDGLELKWIESSQTQIPGK